MIRNILVVRNDRFGEFLLNIPALRALKEGYPQAKLTLAVDSAVFELAGAVECVDAVVVWDEIKGNLRKYKFDLCVILNPTKEAHLSSFLAGIPVRVGYDRKWGILLTHKLKDTKYIGDRHEVDCNLELAGLIGANAQNKSISIKVDDNLFKEFMHEDRGQSPSGTVPFLLVAIHPFTSDPLKQWPVERFKELAQRITKYQGQSPLGTVPSKVKVVFVGKTKEWGQSPFGDSPHSQSLSGIVPSEIIDLINKTSLVELAALLKRCSLLISGDSGPVHLAAAVGTPVIALFRNDFPGKTAKRWGPWGKGHTVIAKANLLDISVEEVLEAIRKAAS